MQAAKVLINNGTSKRKAAETLGIGESALRKRLKIGTGVVSLGRFKRTFNDEKEKELANHCKDLDSRFYGLSFKKLQQLSFQFAEKNGITNKFNKEKQLAGYDWTISFIKRHSLSLRTPQKTSVARIMGFNLYQINIFYENLKLVYTNFNFPPSRIYNMDETGILTVPNKIPKVISPKGKKIVGKSVAAERGELVTAVCCFSASGLYVPPNLIFPRKRMKAEYLNGAPPETIASLSDSGYINSELFIKWIEHFKNHTKPSQFSPVLLILDNHSSHINLTTITFCRENYIHLVSIPPHSSHRTQPLDRCFFKPLKDRYAFHYDLWTTSHPGRTVTLYQIAEIFGQAYAQTATMEKALNAFKMCGIWPLNPNIFNDLDFLPSTVTDQSHLYNQENIMTNTLVLNNQAIMENNRDILNIMDMPVEFGHTDETECTAELTSLVVVVPSEHSSQTMILNERDTAILPSDIIPIPKVTIQRNRRLKGKKSEILSSSPYKAQMEALENEKKEKEKAKLETLAKRRETKAQNTKKSKNKQLVSNNSSIPVVQSMIDSSTSANSTTSTEIVCPACEETYCDPPTEDWIMCSVCKIWWHETCTYYEGVSDFMCDLCYQS